MSEQTLQIMTRLCLKGHSDQALIVSNTISIFKLITAPKKQFFFILFFFWGGGGGGYFNLPKFRMFTVNNLTSFQQTVARSRYYFLRF